VYLSDWKNECVVSSSNLSYLFLLKMRFQVGDRNGEQDYSRVGTRLPQRRTQGCLDTEYFNLNFVVCA
jgi:hypothetical protein